MFQHNQFILEQIFLAFPLPHLPVRFSVFRERKEQKGRRERSREDGEREREINLLLCMFGFLKKKKAA